MLDDYLRVSTVEAGWHGYRLTSLSSGPAAAFRWRLRPTVTNNPRRYEWARLLRRVFDIDVLSCAKCGAARMQRIAFVTKPAAIRSVLCSVGLAAESPEPTPSRLARQVEIFDTE